VVAAGDGHRLELDARAEVDRRVDGRAVPVKVWAVAVPLTVTETGRSAVVAYRKPRVALPAEAAVTVHSTREPVALGG
jgi:uncharacterized lipoprotein YbaY